MRHQFASYTNLLRIFDMMAASDGITVSANLFNATVPESWAARMEIAEATAFQIFEEPLDKFVDEDLLDPDVCDPKDDCTEVMVSGDESVRDLLVLAVNGYALRDVIKSAFDGELSNIVQATGKAVRASA